MLTEPHFEKNRKGEWYSLCNACREKNKAYQKIYRQQNAEKISKQRKQFYEKNKEKIQKSQSAFYQKNQLKYLEKAKQYRQNNRERILNYNQTYYYNNRENLLDYKKKYVHDKKHHCEHKTPKGTCKICCPRGHLASIVSRRVRKALQSTKSKKSLEYIGCDIQTFREHLEKSFKENMTWDNFGEWDVDHIIPVLYRQDGVKPSIEEVGRRLHYTNTQAMWHTENMKKGNRYIGDYQPSGSDTE